MKTSLPLFLSLGATALFASALPVQADNKAVTGIGTIRSEFTQPASPADGRDPFFPESLRTVESAAPAPANHALEITDLKVPGISGTPGHLLAIINTHTFSVGEEGDVRTSGGSVHVHCLDIQPNFVMVEVNGQVHRLVVQSQ